MSVLFARERKDPIHPQPNVRNNAAACGETVAALQREFQGHLPQQPTEGRREEESGWGDEKGKVICGRVDLARMKFHVIAQRGEEAWLRFSQVVARICASRTRYRRQHSQGPDNVVRLGRISQMRLT